MIRQAQRQAQHYKTAQLCNLCGPLVPVFWRKAELALCTDITQPPSAWPCYEALCGARRLQWTTASPWLCSLPVNGAQPSMGEAAGSEQWHQDLAVLPCEQPPLLPYNYYAIRLCLSMPFWHCCLPSYGWVPRLRLAQGHLRELWTPRHAHTLICVSLLSSQSVGRRLATVRSTPSCR